MELPRPRWLAPILLSLCASAAGAAPTLAVSYFDNNTGKAELDPLARGLADMLITDLSSISTLQIVERQKLNQILDELALSRSKLIDPATAQKLGKGLAAQYILTGSYLVAGDGLRIDARVIEVQTAKVMASEKVEGKTEDFFALEKDLVDILVKTLDVRLTPSEKSKLRANATQSYAAWSQYSAGLEAADRGDVEKARKLFQAALDADPSYRAARTAGERLAVVFGREDQRRDAAFEALRASLDPKAPDFAAKVNAMFLEMSGPETAAARQRVTLLTWLAEHDLAPVNPGVSRVPLEALGMVSRGLDDPSTEDGTTATCEYLISRYPTEAGVKPQCKAMLENVYPRYRSLTPAQRDAMIKHKKEQLAAQGAEEQALYQQILDLMKVYARKGRR